MKNNLSQLLVVVECTGGRKFCLVSKVFVIYLNLNVPLYRMHSISRKYLAKVPKSKLEWN